MRESLNRRDFRRGRKETGDKVVQRSFPSVGSMMLCVSAGLLVLKGTGSVSVGQLVLKGTGSSP